jgi:hypothetical protein
MVKAVLPEPQSEVPKSRRCPMVASRIQRFMDSYGHSDCSHSAGVSPNAVRIKGWMGNLSDSVNNYQIARLNGDCLRWKASVFWLCCERQLNIHYDNGVLVVVRDMEGISHGEGEQST